MFLSSRPKYVQFLSETWLENVPDILLKIVFVTLTDPHFIILA